jgi:DNA adenine methylase
MRPEKMRREIAGVHRLLAGKAEAVYADYRELVRRARKADLVYMDPPYQGVSNGRDARYFERLDVAAFIEEIDGLNARGIRFIISFDGRTGNRTYGEALPRALELKHVHVHAGRSSQATLSGRDDETVESLYLSPALVKSVPDVPDVLHLSTMPRPASPAI